MSNDMRELLEVFLALSPWIVFVVAVIWSSVYRFASDASREEFQSALKSDDPVDRPRPARRPGDLPR